MAIVADLSGNGSKAEATVKRGTIELPDGVTAPATKAGIMQLYVDAADGDFKAKFGDGTTKVVSPDT